MAKLLVPLKTVMVYVYDCPLTCWWSQCCSAWNWSSCWRHYRLGRFMYMIAHLPAGGATVVVLGTGRVVGAIID